MISGLSCFMAFQSNVILIQKRATPALLRCLWNRSVRTGTVAAWFGMSDYLLLLAAKVGSSRCWQSRKQAESGLSAWIFSSLFYGKDCSFDQRLVSQSSPYRLKSSQKKWKYKSQLHFTVFPQTKLALLHIFSDTMPRAPWSARFQSAIHIWRLFKSIP